MVVVLGEFSGVEIEANTSGFNIDIRDGRRRNGRTTIGSCNGEEITNGTGVDVCIECSSTEGEEDAVVGVIKEGSRSGLKEGSYATTGGITTTSRRHEEGGGFKGSDFITSGGFKDAVTAWGIVVVDIERLASWWESSEIGSIEIESDEVTSWIDGDTADINLQSAHATRHVRDGEA